VGIGSSRIGGSTGAWSGAVSAVVSITLASWTSPTAPPRDHPAGRLTGKDSAVAGAAQPILEAAARRTPNLSHTPGIITAMATWNDIETGAPDFAHAVRALFDAHRHKVLATLRADGSPRVSGIEVQFRDGQVWLGMMPGSRKAADLRRDPRLAVHSASEDPPDGEPGRWPGDAKLAGRAVEVTAVEAGGGEGTGPPPGSHRFRIDIGEVVHTRLGEPADHLVIEYWQAGQGLRSVQRY
jgi:hypothetical protein